MKTKTRPQWLFLFLTTLLLTLQSSKAVEEQFTIDATTTTHDKWFGRYDFRSSVNDGILTVGGKNDIYYTMITIPVSLPIPPRILLIRARLLLYSYGSTRPTSMRKYFAKSNWSETSDNDQYSVVFQDTGSTTTPPIIGYHSIDITQEFGTWITGAAPNYGILLAPETVDNRFNYFLSSETPQVNQRPKIVVDYERLPDFKLPLPGGVSWKLTVEAGGKQYNKQTELDPYHVNEKYYSLDFSHFYVPAGGNQPVDRSNIPIYAPAWGKVVERGYTDDNGWFVKIDHDGDGRLDTGFQSICIHLAGAPDVVQGDYVNQGAKLGIMGETGITEGVHVHMRFYYKNGGGTLLDNYDSPYLNALRIDGRAIKNYKLTTTWRTDLSPNQWTPIFYPSSNTYDP